MNKKILPIIIAAVIAVVVIAGAGVGVKMLRKAPAEDNASTLPQESVSENLSEIEPLPDYTNPIEDVTYNIDENGNVVTLPTNGQNDISSTISNIQSTLATTINKITTTVVGQSNASTTKKNESTGTTKATTTKDDNASTSTTKKKDPNSSTGFIEYVIGDDADSSFAGYRYSSDGYYYCDDKDNWQRGTGYNEMYDKWAPVAAMYIDQVRIKFKYDDKIWMIQLWKGQYGYLLYGAEIGVYTCKIDDYTGNTGDLNHFNVADPEDWLMMQLDCYYCKGGNGQYKKAFTRPWGKYWWCTGFVKGQLTKLTYPRTELKTKNTIEFKSDAQANLFVQGLKQAGFRRAGGADSLVDDSYYCQGKKVWVLWSTIYHDAFVGY